MAKDEALDDVMIELARLKALVEGMPGRLTAVERGIGEISELLGVTDPGFLVSPWWFFRLTKPEARRVWDRLTEWTDGELLPLYDAAEPPPDGQTVQGRRVSRCWFAHPLHRQLLADVYWAWQGSYKRQAMPFNPVQWGVAETEKAFKRIVEDNPTRCVGGCKYLDAKKSGDITWADRTSYINDDVAGRPDNKD